MRLYQSLAIGILLAATFSWGAEKKKAAPAKATPPKVESKNEIATLSGGCFWGVQELVRKLKGVVSTRVGYTGGHVEKPTYEQVHAGNTGHAEGVEITFDPKVISYDAILRYFFRIHDPTTPNQQGNDIGTSYRSAIFYHSPAQQAVAIQVKTMVDKSKKWKKPVVTEIVAAGPFYPAEEEHQDYLQKHPTGYTCHYERSFSF